MSSDLKNKSKNKNENKDGQEPMDIESTEERTITYKIQEELSRAWPPVKKQATTRKGVVPQKHVASPLKRGR